MSKIQFVSQVEGLEKMEELLPKPSKFFIPDWFKTIPSNNNGITTVKKCPSFPDYFSQGYIIPMWADTTMSFDKDLMQYRINHSNMFPEWSMHGNGQLVDFVTPTFNGSNAEFVFKAICPWRIITEPGWSVLQLPLFYHFNKDWSILPGVIDTDIHHEINQQVLYHGSGEEIKITRGEPFVMYVPYKREKHKMEVRYQNEKDRKKFRNMDLNFSSKMIGSGLYRSMQRKRDNG